jgi:hypothetical protein
VVEDLLKLANGFFIAMSAEIRLSTHVWRVEVPEECKPRTRYSEIVRRRGLQMFKGGRRSALA